jgi:hypothetical protein
MKMGLQFLFLGVALGAIGALAGQRAWILAWPALAAFVVAAGYFGLGGRVLGKRDDGTLSLPIAALMLPYLALAWAIWRVLRRVTGVAPSNRVAPGLTIGRRLLAHELPPETTLIVDLTAEFTEPADVREGRVYRALPTLDGWVPAAGEFLRLVDEVAAFEGEVFVHCAAGHGRSACFMAAVLVRRGLASDVEDAERLLRAVRPTVGLGRHQRATARLAERQSLERSS